MTWLSGPSLPDSHPIDPQVVTVAELIQASAPLCYLPGPAWAKCIRTHRHPAPCATLGTDGTGEPIVVTWYRPTGPWPLSGDPGE